MSQTRRHGEICSSARRSNPSQEQRSLLVSNQIENAKLTLDVVSINVHVGEWKSPVTCTTCHIIRNAIVAATMWCPFRTIMYMRVDLSMWPLLFGLDSICIGSIELFLVRVSRSSLGM